MSPRRRRPLTLLDIAYGNLREGDDRRGAVRAHIDAARALSIVWQLAFARERLGHWPTQEEYASYWEVTERTAQREWQLFRRAFPTEEDPQRLARILHSEFSARLASGPAVASSFPADDLALAA